MLKMVEWWVARGAQQRRMVQSQLDAVSNQNSTILGQLLSKVDLEQVLKEKDRMIAELQFKLAGSEADLKDIEDRTKDLNGKLAASRAEATAVKSKVVVWLPRWSVWGDDEELHIQADPLTDKWVAASVSLS